jgi:hypothetical protein
VARQAEQSEAMSTASVPGAKRTTRRDTTGPDACGL